MDASCIILNYNDADQTISLVEEIKEYEEINHIIVVDNLSTDNSYKVLKTYETEKVDVIITDTNGGYGYGNNIGIRYAHEQYKSEYIIIANPDVHFSNETITKMKCIFNYEKNVGIVAPKALKPTGDDQNLIAWKLQNKIDYGLSASMIYIKYFSNKYYNSSYFIDNKLMEVDVVPGSLLMIKTSYMLKYGMYDENIFLYGEEEILALKFRENGFKTYIIINDTYVHDHSVSISKSFPKAVKQKEMNLTSRKYILNNYYNTSNFEKKFFNIYFKLASLENRIIFKIKDMFNV